MGFANTQGRGELATKHLAEVNGLNFNTALDYVHQQFEIWAKRSEYQWTLNIDVLKNYGIDLPE